MRLTKGLEPGMTFANARRDCDGRSIDVKPGSIIMNLNNFGGLLSSPMHCEYDRRVNEVPREGP